MKISAEAGRGAAEGLGILALDRPHAASKPTMQETAQHAPTRDPRTRPVTSASTSLMLMHPPNAPAKPQGSHIRVMAKPSQINKSLVGFSVR
jgi:hypothetical protein